VTRSLRVVNTVPVAGRYSARQHYTRVLVSRWRGPCVWSTRSLCLDDGWTTSSYRCRSRGVFCWLSDLPRPSPVRPTRRLFYREPLRLQWDQLFVESVWTRSHWRRRRRFYVDAGGCGEVWIRLGGRRRVGCSLQQRTEVG